MLSKKTTEKFPYIIKCVISLKDNSKEKSLSIKKEAQSEIGKKN